MSVITILKTKYEELRERARAYESLKRAIVRGGFFDMPPTRKRDVIFEAFRKSGLYNEKLLMSLKKGLTRSRYFL